MTQQEQDGLGASAADAADRVTDARWRACGGHYEVSDFGAVRRGFRYLKPTMRNGYARVGLSIGGKKRDVAVHQLVAEAFLGPCPPGHQVAHIDGDRGHNHAANLCYKTPAQNEADKVGHGTSQHGARNTNARLDAAAVTTIRARLATGETQKAVAQDYGVAKTTVANIAQGKTWATDASFPGSVPTGADRDLRQHAVFTWACNAFGREHALSIPQRGIRLAEEAIELAQAAGCERDMLHALVDYIFDREPGTIGQEIGGVGLTLLAFAEAADESADAREAAELERVLSKPLAHFAERNRIKNDAGFDLSPNTGADQ